MPQYIVEIEYTVWAKIEIDAANEDDAQDQLERAYYAIPGEAWEERHDAPTVYAVTAVKAPQQQ